MTLRMLNATEAPAVALDRNRREYKVGSVFRAMPCDCEGAQSVAIVTEVVDSTTVIATNMFVSQYSKSFSVGSYYEAAEHEIIADPPVYTPIEADADPAAVPELKSVM